jgi:hypothetical protein
LWLYGQMWPTQSAGFILRNLNIAQKAIADGRHCGDVARPRGFIPNQTRGSAMLLVNEFSETAQSLQTSSRSSLLLISRTALRTLEALGSTGGASPRSNDAQLAFSNLNVGKRENMRFVLRHEFITPLQEMIMGPS